MAAQHDSNVKRTKLTLRRKMKALAADALYAEQPYAVPVDEEPSALEAASLRYWGEVDRRDTERMELEQQVKERKEQEAHDVWTAAWLADALFDLGEGNDEARPSEAAQFDAQLERMKNSPAQWRASMETQEQPTQIIPYVGGSIREPLADLNSSGDEAEGDAPGMPADWKEGSPPIGSFSWKSQRIEDGAVPRQKKRARVGPPTSQLKASLSVSEMASQDLRSHGFTPPTSAQKADFELAVGVPYDQYLQMYADITTPQ